MKYKINKKNTNKKKSKKENSILRQKYIYKNTDLELNEEKKTLNFLKSTLRKIHKNQLNNIIISEMSREFSLIWNHKILERNTISIIGLPLNGGQKISGCDKTPEFYRKENYFSRIKEIGWNVKDCGNLDFKRHWKSITKKKPDPKNIRINDCHQVGLFSQIIADKIFSEIRRGNFILNIGGDHSIAFGTLAGVLKARPKTQIFWIDAHADCNTPNVSPSGNLHGMPLGGHLGAINMCSLPGWKWFKPNLHHKNVIFIGLRDLDRWEKCILRGIGTYIYTREDVTQKGIGLIMRECLEIISTFKEQPIHLSFDIDAIDPQWAPSTGTISPGGLTYREARFICFVLSKTGCLCSMDLAEINTQILQGALAGHPDEVITKNCSNSRKMNPNVLNELEKNPSLTLRIGWDLILSALGETII